MPTLRNKARGGRDAYAAGKPVAAVCHAPAVLRHAKSKNGAVLMRGKAVIGFSNSEEEAVQLSQVVPFLLENELKAKGGIYSKAEDWHPHTIVDGKLITGQNPASSEPAAEALLTMLASWVIRPAEVWWLGHARNRYPSFPRTVSWRQCRPIKPGQWNS